MSYITSNLQLYYSAKNNLNEPTFTGATSYDLNGNWLYDLSGNNNNGIIYGIMPTDNNNFLFQNLNDRIELPYKLISIDKYNEYTVEIVFKAYDVTKKQTLLLSNKFEFPSLFIIISNKKVIASYDSTNNLLQSTTILKNTSYQLIYSVKKIDENSYTQTMYLNTFLQDTNTFIPHNRKLKSKSEIILTGGTIGGYKYKDEEYQNYNGEIKIVRIYNKNLTENEILQNYQSSLQ